MSTPKKRVSKKKVLLSVRRERFLLSLKYKPNYLRNPLRAKHGCRLRIYVRLTQNNMFCTLLNGLTGEVLITVSSGKYKLKITKKSLRYHHRTVLKRFLSSIVKCRKEKAIIVRIKAPIKLRRSIIRQVRRTFKKIRLVVEFKNAKIFNGCRPCKKRRRSQTGLRIPR